MQTFGDIYVPDIGEVVTIKYGGEVGVKSVKGKVTKHLDTEPGPSCGYRLRAVDTELDWKVRAMSEKAPPDIYVHHSDGWHRMNVVPGDLKVVEIH